MPTKQLGRLQMESGSGVRVRWKAPLPIFGGLVLGFTEADFFQVNTYFAAFSDKKIYVLDLEQMLTKCLPDVNRI